MREGVSGQGVGGNCETTCSESAVRVRLYLTMFSVMSCCMFVQFLSLLFFNYPSLLFFHYYLYIFRASDRSRLALSCRRWAVSASIKVGLSCTMPLLALTCPTFGTCALSCLVTSARTPWNLASLTGPCQEASC